MATITPDSNRQSKLDNPFDSKILRIVVGPSKTVYNVHENCLATTAFFNVEGPAPTAIEKETQKLARQQATDKSSTFIPEELEDVKTDVITNQKGADVADDIVPDFVLQDRFIHKPGAFTIFVSFLYNVRPSVPESRTEVRTLFQAYVIAFRYECADLQNLIIDNLRTYHSRTFVMLDDLIWMVNRVGDNAECPLTAYLIEQIAYEIVTAGFANFRKRNRFMDKFLQEGDRRIRKDLFEAIARHSDKDPATTTTKKWHVERNRGPMTPTS